MPPAFAHTLALSAQKQAQRNLAFAAETAKLYQVFASSAVPVIFFKGVVTALSVYGDIGVRHSKDIDLLVSPEQIADAGALLEKLGYHRIEPPPTLNASQLKALRSVCKDYVYVGKSDPSLQIELHWRLFNNPVFMAALSGKTAGKTVALSENINLPTFTDDDHFSYLCAHGAAYGWCRLKWLADIGAMLSAASVEEIKRLLHSATVAGAGRAAAQALLLCENLLGLKLEEGFAASLRRDIKVCWLKNLALTAMTRGQAAMKPDDLLFGMRLINLSPWLLGKSWRYFMGELKFRLVSPEDVAYFALPEKLHFLYWILRGPLWVWRFMRRHCRDRLYRRGSRAVHRPRYVLFRI